MLGKPTIATAYSGNLDFMNQNNSVLVGYDLTEIETDAYQYKKGHHWAEPSIPEAANAMRWVFNHPEEVRSLGERARLSTSLSSPRECGRRMLHRLNQIRSERSGKSPVVRGGVGGRQIGAARSQARDHRPDGICFAWGAALPSSDRRGCKEAITAWRVNSILAVISKRPRRSCGSKIPTPIPPERSLRKLRGLGLTDPRIEKSSSTAWTCGLAAQFACFRPSRQLGGKAIMHDDIKGDSRPEPGAGCRCPSSPHRSSGHRRPRRSSTRIHVGSRSIRAGSVPI